MSRPRTRHPLTPQQTNYQKGANAELARDFDKAFRLYLKAAEQFLHLNRQTTDERLRAQCKAEAAKALERAEKIKAVKQDVRPVAKDEFSDSEPYRSSPTVPLRSQGLASSC